jgi:hypothetical protein
MTTPRRDFLKRLGATGAFAAIGLPASLQAEASHHDVPVSATWDMSWVDRVTGKVRAVFDSPHVDEGSGMFRAQLWRDQHIEVYGAPLSDISAVLVIRHEAIPLVMNDAYWQRFDLGKELKLKDENDKKWTKVNPVGVLQPGTPEKYTKYNIAEFIKSGGIVLACNLAFGEIVAKFMKEDKLAKDDARKRALEHLIPGVILQPSGGFAVLRAQQAGCNYLFAS